MRVLPGFLALLVAVWVAAGPALSPASAAGQSTPLAALPDAAMQLTAYGGYVVFSEYDAQANDWRLMDWHDGTVSALPVAPRSVPFDADAGSDATGQPVVVYSRCAREPSGAGAPLENGVDVDWSTARGCHVFELDLTSGQEQEVSALVAPGASDTTPAIWDGEIALARTYSGHAPLVPRIMLWRARHGVQRLRGGPGPCSPPLRCQHTPNSTNNVTLDTFDPRAYVSAMTLDGDIVGFDWNVIGPNVGDFGTLSELVVDQLDGGLQQFADTSFYGGDGGVELPSSPTADGDSLLYMWQQAGGPGYEWTWLVSFSPANVSWRKSPTVKGTQLAAVAVSGSTIYSIDFTPNQPVSNAGGYGDQPGICAAQPVTEYTDMSGSCELTANTNLTLKPEPTPHVYFLCPDPVTAAPGALQCPRGPNGWGYIFTSSPSNQ